MSANLILEQIKRFKLLTTYDSKLTLTENESKIEMSELKTPKSFINSVGLSADEISAGVADYTKAGRQFSSVANVIQDALPYLGDGLKSAGKNGKLLKTAEEILDAINTNNLAAGELSRLKKNMLKSTKINGAEFKTLRNDLTQESADLILGNNSFKGLNGVEIPLDKLKNKEIQKTLVQKGYPDAVAREIEEKVMMQKSKTAKVTVPDRTATPDGGMPPKDGGGRGKAGTDVVDGDGGRRRTGTDAVDGGDWKKLDKDGIVVNKNGDVIEIIFNGKIMQTIDNTPFYKRWIKSGKTTWKTILPYLIGAGIGSLLTGFLYGLFSRNGKQYFPQCIGGSIMLNPEALKKTAEAGLSTNQAYMMDPKHPPLMNALVTSTVDGQSGTMELADGRKATYQQKNEAGRNIVEVKDSSGAVVYVIDCSTNVEIKIENPTPTPPPVPVPSGCAPASDFPFGYYQSNPKVTEVQQCVGASQDSCMGPETARGIKSFLGLSQTPTSLTKDIYDQVMAKCGKNTKEETKPKEPEERFGGGTKTFGA